MREAKINAVLIGEHLMTAKNIEEKFKELKEWCNKTEDGIWKMKNGEFTGEIRKAKLYGKS